MAIRLKPVRPKQYHNYVAFFLTLACNLRCPYCINLHDGGARYAKAKRKHMDVDAWIQAANRLVLRDDLPLSLQGGEPTLCKDFYRFVNEVKEDIKMDLLTNMMFDVAKFIKNVPTWRFNRPAPYAAIRVSYHPEQNDIDDLINKTFVLQDAGFRIGIYGIEYPSIRDHILKTKERCLKLGIDFRIKEFLGQWQGRLYGSFKYEGSVQGDEMKRCECRTTEIIVDPAGHVYKCHSDLYNGRNPFAHILDDDFNEDGIERFRSCDFYGDCNPCDVKVKTNRLQVFGHTSVEIRNIEKQPVAETVPVA